MEMQTEKNEISNDLKYGITQMYIFVNKDAIKLSCATNERGIERTMNGFERSVVQIISIASFNPKFAVSARKQYRKYRERAYSIDNMLRLWDNISTLLRENKIITINDLE